MADFTISRIETSKGIYRLSGSWNSNNFTISQIEGMGTDGWVPLDLTNTALQDLLQHLAPEFIAHLEAKSAQQQTETTPVNQA